MNKKKLKVGLSAKMLLLSIAPIFTLTILIMIFAVAIFSKEMTKQVQTQMEEQCDFLLKLYDREYPGDYSLEKYDDGSYYITKGDKNISKDYTIIKDMKSIQGLEVTMFCQNVRLITTLEDKEGKPYINSIVATKVKREVMDAKKEQFYKNTTINGVKHFAYYKPIIEDGKCFGMIGICKKSSEVRKSVVREVVPVGIMSLIAMFAIGFISAWYARKIVENIFKVQRFMQKVSEGDFEVQMSPLLLKCDDEIGNLARCGDKMEKSIKMLVEYDALTELYNRRYGDEKLSTIVENSGNSKNQCCVCIADIDFFKKVNDTYGHDAGDKVLIEVSKSLRKNMAGNGFVARWGGEEFLIVFKHSDLQTSVTILEKISQEIKENTVKCDDNEIKVTVSMGITELTPEMDKDKVLKVADERLYFAKTNGRNQIKYSD